MITTPFSSHTGSSTNFTRIVIEWTNNQNIIHIQMSTTTQNIDQVSTEVKFFKPTWQDIEKVIVNIVQAGVDYKKKKNENFPMITTPFSSHTGSSTNFTRIVIEWTNNQNIIHIQMSTTTQNIDQVSTEVKFFKPTWQDIEKVIVNIVQAGVDYKKKKNEKFMQNYKKRYTELHEAEDPDIHVLDIAKRIVPNEEKYIESKKQYQEWYKYKNELKILQDILKLNYLYYQLAKDYFATNEEIEKKADDFLNS
ncbi:hypothetical protein Glove_209g78 [Diversispora epigaea]|uniref:Uncharacterized protein n=1 Tax=Diversispora epigaea TaxID=1348612 RepID=A0A397IS53_9GLOM|nr:hypothetical protein Glove_209g78 [Diversispora epigaea]